MDEGAEKSRALEAILRLLAGVVKAHPDQQKTVDDIRELLEGMVADKAVRPSTGQKRKGEGTRYTVGDDGRESVLSEHRKGSQPLRVGKELFDAAVAVFEEADKPLAYDDIVARLESRLDARPAEWQVRVILRYLTTTPTILKRERARYLAPNRKTFGASARKLWRGTAST